MTADGFFYTAYAPASSFCNNLFFAVAAAICWLQALFSAVL